MKDITESLGNHLYPEYRVWWEMYNKILATQEWIGKNLNDTQGKSDFPITHPELVKIKKDWENLLKYYRVCKGNENKFFGDKSRKYEKLKNDIYAYITSIQQDKYLTHIFWHKQFLLEQILFQLYKWEDIQGMREKFWLLNWPVSDKESNSRLTKDELDWLFESGDEYEDVIDMRLMWLVNSEIDVYVEDPKNLYEVSWDVIRKIAKNEYDYIEDFFPLLITTPYYPRIFDNLVAHNDWIYYIHNHDMIETNIFDIKNSKKHIIEWFRYCNRPDIWINGTISQKINVNGIIPKKFRFDQKITEEKETKRKIWEKIEILDNRSQSM